MKKKKHLIAKTLVGVFTRALVMILLLAGCLLAGWLALSAFSAVLPLSATCAKDVCVEGREWFATLATFLVILGGLYQYWSAQQWKRAEWVAGETQAFFSDPKVMNALYMLDWNARRLPLLLDAPESKQTYFEYGADLLDTALYSRSTIPLDPQTKMERSFTEEELAIRDSFDRMLSRLERFEIFVRQGLVSFADLRPYIEYWIELIGDADFGRKPKATIKRLWSYINDYGFDGVQSLCRRFGYDIVPRR